jgi:hypothetical protein
MIKKYNEYNENKDYEEIVGYDDIDVLKKANEIFKQYSENMSYIYTALNEDGVDYYNWNDLEVVIYYIENLEEND